MNRALELHASGKAPGAIARELGVSRQRVHQLLSPSKSQARTRVAKAIASGKLVPAPCAVCGGQPTEAHHDDYSKPLEVTWLCKEDHTNAHHPGRTPKEDAPIQIGFRAPIELAERLRERAYLEHVSQSTIVRRAVEAELNKP